MLAYASRQFNPFAASNGPASFDFGSMIFGSEQPSQPESGEIVETAPEPADTASDLSTSKVTNTAVPWSSNAKAFTAHYLTTSSEYLSPSFASKGKQGQLVKKLAEMSMSQDGVPEPKEQHKGGRIAKSGSKAGSDSSGAGDGWSAEAYEVMRLSGVEEVFLAFQERLEASYAQEQVIRYEFKGTPLPFQAKSKPYQLLFSKSAAPGGLTTVTRTAHATPAASQDIRRYDETCSKVDRCIHCQSPRTFEMQLMPNIVNILEAQLDGKAGEELGWATVWCFTCSADCLDAPNEGSDEDGLDWQGWREEVAMVELED
jgi:pre-rRNA-processing protein TSR4